MTLAAHPVLTRTLLLAGLHRGDLSDAARFDDRVVVIGDVTDASSAVSAAGRLQPDVIIFDDCIERFDAVSAAVGARRAAPGSTIVLLTADPNVERRARRAGVDAVYGKSATLAAILGFD